jgi:DNA-nicking Smr family endonuclease
MARRKLTDDERELLARAMRAVRPIAKPRAAKKTVTTFPPPPAGEADPWTRTGGPEGAIRAATAPSPPSADLPRKWGRKESDLRAIDRRTDQKLKRGQMPVDATLDLHGLSQERAHRRLNSFLAKASAEGSRTVLVITGKGRADPAEEGAVPAERRGILREAVPRWIEQAPLRDLVWGIRPAGPRQGGHGALYVLLKRPK